MARTPSKIKAYLASPLGFSEVTAHYMRKVYVPALENVGVNCINPWDLTTDAEVQAVMSLPEGPEKIRALHDLHREIGKRNRVAIIMCPLLIAQLDGQELDSGTVAEVGYAVGRGKVVMGWRSDFRQSGEVGRMVNLQVESFIEESGGSIFRSLDALCAELKRFRAMFEGAE